MKLRNKKTGEIVELCSRQQFYEDKTHLFLDTKNGRQYYGSLAELNAEWEDYEEPKEFYFIDQFMSVSKGVVDDVEYAGRNSAVNYAKKTSNNLKTAGNYFETKEEAELAVRKLKAWKRLKSHDLFISKGNRTFVNTDDVFVVQNVEFRIDMYGDIEEDLDLLFSGGGE